MRKPDFFIVGAPKCGTTAMHAYLAAHPDVFMPSQKEPHFFGSDLEFHDQRRPDEPAYRALFEAAGTERRLGEASVFYLCSERAADEIHAFQPTAQIVVMLRNPIDVMYSFHSQRLYNGTESIEDFGEALAAIPERRAGRRLPHHLGLRQGLFYTELVRFAPQLERYIERFGRERVHVIFYEEFRNDPRGAYRGLCRFLGVDPDVEPEFGVVNPNKVARIGWLRDLLWRPPPVVRRVVRVLLPGRARARTGKALRRLNTVQQERASLAPALRSRLEGEFASEVVALEKLLGRDLAIWWDPRAPGG